MTKIDQPLDLLAFGPHPDDLELACGATLAQLSEAGTAVGMVHLTRGEAGTRGTPEEREQEAKAAAEILGVRTLDFLHCGDGALRTGPDEEDAVIALLRRYRPRVVLGPPPSDRHPDHGRAHRLIRDACFYAGLARRASGEPHRPNALFCYMQHNPFEPSFIVDATAGWPRKIEALAAYRTQLYQGEDDPGGVKTKVSSREFALAVEGRARHYGQLIQCEFGEPFWSELPIAVRNPMEITPRGLA